MLKIHRFALALAVLAVAGGARAADRVVHF